MGKWVTFICFGFGNREVCMVLFSYSYSAMYILPGVHVHTGRPLIGLYMYILP